MYSKTDLKPFIICEKTKNKYGKKLKGKTLSEEHRRKISESWKYRTVSEETKHKISKGLFGKKKSLQHRLNISNSRKGFKHSNESKLKMSISKKGIVLKNISIQKKIEQYNMDNVFIKTWNSISEASKSLKIATGNISSCCKNIRKSAGNFKFKYV